MLVYKTADGGETCDFLKKNLQKESLRTNDNLIHYCRSPPFSYQRKACEAHNLLHRPKNVHDGSRNKNLLIPPTNVIVGTGLFFFLVLFLLFSRKEEKVRLSTSYNLTSVRSRICRPCRGGAPREWSRCRRPAGDFPGRQSTCGEAPPRYCSGCEPDISFRPRR